MATSSKDYWIQRERENLERNLKAEAEYYKEIEDIYRYTMDQIQKEIDSFYAKYASKEGISIAEAKKRASKLDMEEFSRKAKKYVEEKNFSKQANDEMRLYNLTMKVNRLELLKAQIGLELVAGFDELQQFFEEKLTERTMEEFQRQAGILGLTLLDNAKMAEAIVNASFKNATFSERIWTHQDLLRAELEKALRTGLIQGRNPRELARQIRKVFNASIFNSERLLRTELARVQTEVQKQSYIRNGFDQYTYISCSDFKVCDVCRELNGKHFDVDDMMPGDNAPPMHPCCRCSTAAYIDDKSYNEWLEGYKDHGLSFADWKNRKILGAKKNVAYPNTKREELGYIDVSKLNEAKKYYGDVIRNEKVEHGIIIQKDGKVVHFIGEEGGFSPYDVDLNGAVVIHNHPSSNGIVSFGEDDFIFIRDTEDLKEMIAVNEQYTYSVSVLKDMRELSYNEIYKKALKYFDADDFEFQHGVFQFLNDEGYVKYERKKIE